MRYWKRIPALLLALVTVLSCFATALAAAPEAEIYPIAPAADAKKEALVGFKSEEFRRANAYSYAPDETDASMSTIYGYAGDNLLEYVPFHEEHIAISTPWTAPPAPSSPAWSCAF